MSQHLRSQPRLELLEDRCTPSSSPFNFGSIFGQLESRLSEVFSKITLPSLPSLPSLTNIQLPSLPSIPSFSPPSIPQVSLPSLPQFPPTQLQNLFDTRLADALTAAQSALEHVHSQADSLIHQLAESLIGHFPG